MIHIKSIFKRLSVDDIRREQLAEAERAQVEHQAAAEYHAGMVGIYRVRVERLRNELHAEPHATLRAVKS